MVIYGCYIILLRPAKSCYERLRSGAIPCYVKNMIRAEICRGTIVHAFVHARNAFVWDDVHHRAGSPYSSMWPHCARQERQDYKQAHLISRVALESSPLTAFSSWAGLHCRTEGTHDREAPSKCHDGNPVCPHRWWPIVQLLRQKCRACK